MTGRGAWSLCAVSQKAGEASHSFCSIFSYSENSLWPGSSLLAVNRAVLGNRMIQAK